MLDFCPNESHFLLCSREVKRNNCSVRENNAVVKKYESLDTTINAESDEADFT